MNPSEIKIGTRGSPLALYQANWVKEQLVRADPDLKVTLLKIKTTGDKIQDAPLAKVGGKGLFVKEIEEALIRKRIDLAVHSIKDVPTEFPEGLHLAAITKREDPRDVLISKEGRGLKDLPQRAKLGTSSLRRQAQILHYRSDLDIVPLRGNLDTRLRKLDELNLDAIVLALAGVRRMGLSDRITEILPPEVSLPAIGQGALGIETRIGDSRIEERVRFLDDPESSVAVRGERAFLKRLGGGCQVPIAAFGRMEHTTFRIDGLVGMTDGTRLIKHRMEGPPQEAEAIGRRLAEFLLDHGAKEILDHLYLRPTDVILRVGQGNKPIVMRMHEDPAAGHGGAGG